MKHRTFIALFPPPGIRQKLTEIQVHLQSIFREQKRGTIRWEKNEKFHFTMQFLGEQDDATIHHLANDITVRCASIEQFTIVIDTLSCFPGPFSPKILWIGSNPPRNRLLMELSSTIYEMTSKRGIAREGSLFLPHITIARNKGNIPPSLIKKFETVTFEPIEFLCGDVHIMKSNLASTGSTYTTLFTIPLK
ncbi:MAG: RNA 2',3'-cyclic phosphodiesterase [Bacteroidota bacterium]|jgi:2'-5' RNA ligase